MLAGRIDCSVCCAWGPLVLTNGPEEGCGDVGHRAQHRPTGVEQPHHLGRAVECLGAEHVKESARRAYGHKVPFLTCSTAAENCNATQVLETSKPGPECGELSCCELLRLRLWGGQLLLGDWLALGCYCSLAGLHEALCRHKVAAVCGTRRNTTQPPCKPDASSEIDQPCLGCSRAC